MAGQVLSAFDAVLKDFYGPGIVTLLNNKNKILKLFTKNVDKSLSVDGRDVIYPIHYKRNPAVGAIAESGTLPVALYQGTTSVTVPYRYNYGRIQLSEQTIKQSQTSKGAFKKAMELEMKNITKDLDRDRSRQLFGYGVGIIALVNGAHGAADTVIKLKSPGGVTLPNGITTGGARLVLPSQYVSFVRNATPTSATDADIISGAKQISSIASDLTTVTLGAVTGAVLADGDMLVNSSGQSATESSVNKEVMGLVGMVDDSTYLTTIHGVSRSSYPQYKSTVISVNGQLSLDTLQRGLDAADEKGGELKGMKFISHHSVRREYLNLMQTPRRYIGEMTMNPDAGFKGGAGLESDSLTYAMKEWIVERMCPLGMIFGLDTSFNVRYVNCEGEFADDDGTILMRVANTDAYEGRFRVFDNFHNDRPDCCVRFDNIQSTYDPIAVE